MSDNWAGGESEVITLDLGQARKNFGSDESLLYEIAMVFIEDVPLIVAELEAACQRNDITSVCRLAHSLKGLCATFGAEPARTYAQRIELDASIAGQNYVARERILTLIQTLEQTIQTLRSELEKTA